MLACLRSPYLDGDSEGTGLGLGKRFSGFSCGVGGSWTSTCTLPFSLSGVGGNSWVDVVTVFLLSVAEVRFVSERDDSFFATGMTIPRGVLERRRCGGESSCFGGVAGGFGLMRFFTPRLSVEPLGTNLRLMD